MKHPDGTPFTPPELTAERFRRWEWLAEQQRSARPISPEALPLFERYANGELSSEEAIEALHRLYHRRRFPEGSDGPEVPESPTSPASDEVEVCEGVMVMVPDPPQPLAEETLSRLLEWSRQQHPDDPLIGKTVTFTASYPGRDERELN